MNNIAKNDAEEIVEFKTYALITGIITLEDGKFIKGWFHLDNDKLHYVLKPIIEGAALFQSVEYAKNYIQGLRSVHGNGEVAEYAKLLAVQTIKVDKNKKIISRF